MPTPIHPAPPSKTRISTRLQGVAASIGGSPASCRISPPRPLRKIQTPYFKMLPTGFFADNPTPRPQETGLMKFWNPIPKFQFSHLFLKKCESNPIQAFPTCPGFEGSMIAVGWSALPCFTELVALSIPLLPAKGFTLLDWLDDQKEIIIAARLVSQTLHLQI